MAIEPESTPDREPQPSDGPDYHADHAAWEERQRPARKVDAFLDAAAGEVAYVRPVMMFEAVCTCGWKQVHTLKSNAEYDAREHYKNGRHR